MPQYSNISVKPDNIIRKILDFSDLLCKDTKHDKIVQNLICKLHSMRAVLLRPSHTGGKTGCRPLMTAKFSVVFGSLVEVADHRATVLLTFGPKTADL